MSRAQIRQSHVMYVLACEHVVLSAPSLVSARLSIWCPQDMAEHRVVGIHKYEWRSVCVQCTFARWCGTSEMLAQQIANEHARSTQHKAKAEYVINPSAIEELIRLRKMKAILCMITVSWISGKYRNRAPVTGYSMSGAAAYAIGAGRRSPQTWHTARKTSAAISGDTTRLTTCRVLPGYRHSQWSMSGTSSRSRLRRTRPPACTTGSAHYSDSEGMAMTFQPNRDGTWPVAPCCGGHVFALVVEPLARLVIWWKRGR